jgi:hypothetical protein
MTAHHCVDGRAVPCRGVPATAARASARSSRMLRSSQRCPLQSLSLASTPTLVRSSDKWGCCWIDYHRPMSCACCGSTPRLSAVPLAPHPVRLARSALARTAVVGLVCAVALTDSCGDSASAPCNSTASDPGEGFGVDEVRMRCSPAALNPALGVGRAGPGRWHRTIPPLCAMAVMHSARLPLRRDVHVSHIRQRTSGTCPLPARWRRPVQLRCRRVPTCTCEAARPEPVGAARMLGICLATMP